MRTLPLPLAFFTLILGLIGGRSLAARETGQPPEHAAAHEEDPSDALFAGEIPTFRFAIGEAEVTRLRAEPRGYVRATMEVDGKASAVGIRLKGSAGSFRDIDDRPALTVDVRRYDRDASFRGLTRFHLNNSVQDESLLNELLGSEAFRAAGVPATRVTHARVWLNGRDCGLYVLKESFGPAFLRRHGADASGNLYDGGLLQDLDAELHRESGEGEPDRDDLRAIVEARRDEDFPRCIERLEALVDMDALVTFMAVERLIGHWDGYTDSANNYRVYVDPTRHKALLLPHGMDQVYGDPAARLYEDAAPMLSSAVLRSDRWFGRYRERVRELAPKVFDVARMEGTIDRATRRLAPILADMGADAVARHAASVADLKRRIHLRAAFLAHHVNEGRAPALAFEGDAPRPVLAWSALRESDAMRLEAIERIGERCEYRITCGGAETAESSWQATLPLSRGRYLLRAALRTDEVIASTEEPAIGAALLSSAGEPSPERLGTTEWSEVEVRIEVAEDWRAVQCSLRLHALRGSATMRDARITRVP